MTTHAQQVAGSFNWEEDDTMDGYDTEPVRMPIASPPAQAAAAKVVGDVLRPPPVASPTAPEPPPEEELSEVEKRLEKAQYYRAILNSQLLASDSPLALEVEAELQMWARAQLEKLMGLKPMDPGAYASSVDRKDVFAIIKENYQFSEEEVAALKLLAGKVLAASQKPSAVEPGTFSGPPKSASKAPVIPTAATPAPVPQTTPAVKPVVTSPTPNRGRPRRKPCRVCGQLGDCEHAARANRNIPPAAAPAAEIQVDGVRYEIDPQTGFRIAFLPDGRRYRLEKRMVQLKDGTMREEEIPRELKVIAPGPKYSSVAELQAAQNVANTQAAVEAQTTDMKIARNPLMQAVVSRAMAAPDREAYIPEDPRKK